MKLRLDTSAGANQVTTWNAGDNFFDGQWHHIAFTINGNAVALYKDGAPDNTGTYVVGGGICNASQGMNFGGLVPGTIDELGVWSTNLFPAEINTIYVHQISPH